MTKDEALKLALEHIEGNYTVSDEDAIAAIKEALAQPEQIPPSVHSNTHQPEQEQIQPDKVCIEDDGCPTEKAVLQRFWREHQKTQPEQEPVAWLHTKIEGVAVPHRPADLDKHPDRWEALYKAPPPCPTCEALARTVMMDQTGRDA